MGRIWKVFSFSGVTTPAYGKAFWLGIRKNKNVKCKTTQICVPHTTLIISHIRPGCKFLRSLGGSEIGPSWTGPFNMILPS